MAVERKYYPAIDIAKFFCALIILFYHYFSEHGSIHPLLEDALSLYAVAVALFMTLSGFLLFSKLNVTPNKADQWIIVKKEVKRIMTIYLLWSIPYLIFSIITWDWGNISFSYIAWEIQGWIFKSTFYTIWFMPALAVGILFTYFLYTRFRWRTVGLIACVLYLIGSLQSTYSFIGIKIPGFVAFTDFSATWLQGSRGGIFFGMPLIIVGAAASKIKWRNPFVLTGTSVFLMVGLLVEALILRKIIGGCGLDLALSMPAVCLSFTLFLTSISWNANYKWMRSMSVLIFMSQRLFFTVLPYFLSKRMLSVLFSSPYTGAVILCGSTVVFSTLIIAGSKKIPFLSKLY